MKIVLDSFSCILLVHRFIYKYISLPPRSITLIEGNVSCRVLVRKCVYYLFQRHVAALSDMSLTRFYDDFGKGSKH